MDSILEILIYTGVFIGGGLAALCGAFVFVWLRKRKRNNADVVPDVPQVDEPDIDIAAEFRGKTADDVAVHRMDIYALANGAEWDDIISAIINGNYSRIPVYDGNVDNIVGILHAKDLLNALLANPSVAECIAHSGLEIQPLLRKPYFVSFNKKLETIYTKMKSGREHMAVVVDEYGGTFGVLTIEDLIEEILGDIYDEHDQDKEEPDIQPLGSNVFIVRGTAPLEQVQEFFKAELPTDEYDTLSGFIVGCLGRIPEEGEHPSFEHEGLVFKIFDAQEKRVLHAFVCVL